MTIFDELAPILIHKTEDHQLGEPRTFRDKFTLILIHKTESSPTRRTSNLPL